MTESINGINEVDILGYFESIKGNFITKLILIASITKEEVGDVKLEFPFDASKVISKIKDKFDDSVIYKAIAKGNEELILNLKEDLVTGALIQSWTVFEQVLKTINFGDYASQPESSNVNYQKNIFQFSKLEKKDIELIYYIRNAIVHYNGAYYSYRSIDHSYGGKNFTSKDNEGTKIEMSLDLAYEIIKDLEKYAIKAWSNAN